MGYGLLVFFILAAGLGLPLAVLAAFSSSISRLPGAGEWMIWVRKFFGLVLVIMAINVAEPLLGGGPGPLADDPGRGGRGHLSGLHGKKRKGQVRELQESVPA